MDGTNGTNGERYIERLVGILRKRGHLENLSVDGRIIFK